ncbi:flagellin B [Helicobacter monodelphidis]|uniref:flagellin B n=1 Tax=Helicobacter sp. 15-1451 TaxID=2004995 RepID=UPI000DCC6670|nr:flagellin B [Helicobacter sp. 15-1451]RAX58609.1 flagellin B [Helicobacter sp. 15-1451]
MAFNINTNIHALNSHAQGTFTQHALIGTLERLSSGLRINKAADDASGMAIADSLRSQANSLGQAMRNANDSIGIIQIADKAMDEQVKVLDTIKTKSIQAAQDGQTTKTRVAIQADINRLIDSLDNIANTTSYNGLTLLAGSYTNKKFQVGAYSNQTVNISIGATSSDKIGHARFETGSIVKGPGAATLGTVALEFQGLSGNKSQPLESVVISTSAGTGLGALAEVINKNSDSLGGTKATFNVQATGSSTVTAGDISNLTINGVWIGDVTGIQDNDRDNKLVQAINSKKEETGVQASIDVNGRLNLTSTDGRAIMVTGSIAGAGGTDEAFMGIFGISNGGVHVGRLSLNRTDATDIKVSGLGLSLIGFDVATAVAQTTQNLRGTKNAYSNDVASAIGANANAVIGADNANGITAGVTTLFGAMAVMNIAESAIRQLDAVRADLGAAQQQIQSTLNNITITQVNVKSAESNIRETDFAEESSTYSKLNILAQAGNYAMSQANATQQNILRLLQ